MPRTAPVKLGRSILRAALDITDPQVVAMIREARPGILLRQFFEPAGRFRVDETGIKYDGKIAPIRD